METYPDLTTEELGDFYRLASADYEIALLTGDADLIARTGERWSRLATAYGLSLCADIRAMREELAA